MNRIKIIFIALLLAAMASWGQQITITTAQPLAAPNFAYSVANPLVKGATIGNHQFDANAHLTGFPALSESGEAAFTVEFAGGHKGLFTSAGRAVVEEGEDIGGGITIVQLGNSRPGDVQIAGGVVSYVATFKGRGCVTATCRGLLTEKALIAVQGGGAGMYTVGEDGKITAPAGSVWLTPTSATASGAGKKGMKSFLSSVACGLAPVLVTPNETGPGGMRIPSKPVNLCGIWAGQTAPQAAPQTPSLAKFEVTPTPAYCTAVAGASFPLPWSTGASAAGPMGTMRAEGTPWGQSYKSSLHPSVVNWNRRLFFAADCRPLLVSLSANGGPALELHTPAGLLATFSPEKGLYDFGGGIPNVTLPPGSSPIENGILINRHCQALVSVRFRTSSGEENGLILGTPKSGCAQ